MLELVWTAPTEDIRNNPLEYEVEYVVYYSRNGDRFQPAEPGGELMLTNGTRIQLPETLGGLECVWVAVQARSVEDPGLASELSESIWYCPGEYLQGQLGDPPDTGQGGTRFSAPQVVLDVRVESGY